ncbi:YczE/YyaS/YitT family protein [Paucilactobacillus vaccinostercus]|jgi:uncharacterized membrane protein YczE|uniref:YczE/YyaS/YitT family protein n=1 Tax=Paucilactobacillus vaccinostercus TaxID=176291 RepID=UPI00070D4F52|nr:hypothetical protein [Paucilactobacillus vaccinostercus]
MKQRRFTWKTIVLAMSGIFLVCIGVSFNNNTQLGNDPVGIIYDGIRATFHVPLISLGMVSNGLNIVLLILLFVIGRHYANVGSLMYLIPYGFFVTIGSHLYPLIFSSDGTMTRVYGGITGITLYYIGISLFICADIGVDPFSGFMLTIRDKMGWSMRRSKITFDLFLIVVGILLGGKFGVITVLTAATTGPTVQFLSNQFKNVFKIQKG